MNTYQEEKHKSNKLVVKEARENPQSTNLIPKFAEGIDKLEAINNKVDEIRPSQEQNIMGVTINKNFTMNNLIGYTIDISGAVHSYAADRSDLILMKKVDYKKGTISRMLPGEIVSAANTTLAEANKISADDLDKEGITSGDLAAYEAMVVHFNSISNAPREAIIDRSDSTQKLANLFAESSKLFKDSLERLAHQFIRRDPAFYGKYRAARNAIHHGGSNSTAVDEIAK